MSLCPFPMMITITPLHPASLSSLWWLYQVHQYNWYHNHLPVPQFFFSSLAWITYLSLFLFSLIFPLCSAGIAKCTCQQVLSFFFLVIIIRFDLLAEIRWSFCISKSQRIYAFHSPECFVHLLSFGTMIKFLQFLSWFPADPLLLPVVSHLIFFLC